MSIFNEEQIKAMFSREYICHECGHLMEFEDEWEDTLVCPHCGHSIDLDDTAVKAMKNMRTYTQPKKKYWALRMIIQTIKKHKLSRRGS